MIKKLDKILIICFLLIIGIPFFGVFRVVNQMKFESDFNRPLAKFPQFVGTFSKAEFSQIDAWFADHALLIPYLGSYWSRVTFIFNVSAKSRQVVVGKENWLFLGNDYAKSIDQFTGVNKPDLEYLDVLVNSFISMNKIAVKYRVPIIFTIAPDKQNIYAEYMPSNLIKGKSSTRLDILTQDMEMDNLPFVNLMKPELNAKQDLGLKYGPLYLKGDSHWNYLGAYVAYQSIVNNIYYNNLSWLKLGSDIDFKSRFVNNTDLTNILQLNNIYSYSPLPEFHSQKFSLNQMYENNVESMSPFDFISNAKISAQPVVISNNLVKDKHTCLLLSDSFSNYLSVYFYSVCSQTVRLHPDAGNKYDLDSLINKYHPDFILFELAERSLIKYQGGFVPNSHVVVTK